MSSSRLAAAALDQLGEVRHHRRHRLADGLRRLGDAAGLGVGGDDGLGPAVELLAVLFGDAEIVRDHHRRQRLEQLGDDVAAAFGPQPLDPLDHELPHLGLDGLHLARREPAGHQLAKLGVHRRVLHHERWVVLQANHFQLAVVDRQALGGRERLVVAGGVPHVGVPGQHPVVLVGALLGHDVVHRILVAQRLVHRPRVGPGLRRGEFEPGRRAMRQSGGHVLWVRHNPIPCQQLGRNVLKSRRRG